MSQLTQASAGWRFLRLAGDLAAGVAAFYLAFLVRIYVSIPLTAFPLPPDRLRFFAREWWVVVIAQSLALYLFGFYDPPRTGAGVEGNRRLLAATSLQWLVLAGWYFLTDRQFPRSVLVVFLIVNFLLLAAWRALLLKLHRPPRRRVAIIGMGGAARELAGKMGSRGDRLLEVVGFLPAPDEEDPASSGGLDPPELGRRLGTVEDLPALLARGEIDDVILAAQSRPWQTRLLDQIAMTQTSGNVLLLPGPIESLIGGMRYRWVEDVPLIEVVRQSEWRVNRPLKRVMDLVGAALLLLLALPLLALCVLAVAVSSPGPVFYRQVRLGLGRRPFTIWKLRTMRQDAERETGEVLATTDDPRLTTTGRWLRRLRLDELPQLLNVLSGAMSLVGPRPERPGFAERFRTEVPGYSERFSVPPGVTGLAQINGDYHSSPENKLRYDLAYIANWSPWLDLAILFQTVKIVLTSRGT